MSPTGCSPYSSFKLTYVDTSVPVMTAISSIGIGTTDRLLICGCQNMCGINNMNHLILHTLPFEFLFMNVLCQFC